jgi:hypothetical protein
MALLWAEGFDAYYDNDNINYKPEFVSAGLGGFDQEATTGRRSKGCMSTFGRGIFGSYAVVAQLPSEVNTCIVGAAIKPTYHATVLTKDFFGFFKLNTSAGRQCMFRYDETGTIYVETTQGSADVATSAAGVLTFAVWNYLEIKCVIGSSGSVVVKVNGVEVINETGVNTQYYGSGGAEFLRFGTPWDGNSWDTCRWDDLVVMDDSGTTFNDFIGDVKVDGVIPDADGFHTDFTPQGAGSHYVEINDRTGPTGVTTTYNTSSVVGDKDSYEFTAPGDVPTILAVGIACCVDNPDTGVATIQPFWRIGGVDYDTDVDWDMAATSVLQHFAWQELNPATGLPWTKAVLTAAEFGIEFKASA